MENLENKQELKEEKIESNLEQEKKPEEASTESNKPKPKKNISFKPRKRLSAKKVKKIFFIRNKVTYIDYKDTKLLKLFINNQGQIVSKVFSRLPSKVQRMVTKSIKRARQIKLMPYIIVDQGSF
jgi:small subunit ribosomal protein S18